MTTMMMSMMIFIVPPIRPLASETSTPVRRRHRHRFVSFYRAPASHSFTRSVRAWGREPWSSSRRCRPPAFGANHRTGRPHAPRPRTSQKAPSSKVPRRRATPIHCRNWLKRRSSNEASRFSMRPSSRCSISGILGHGSTSQPQRVLPLRCDIPRDLTVLLDWAIGAQLH